MATIDTINSNLQILGFDSQSSVSIVNKIADAIAPLIDNTINEISNTENIITDLLISQYGLGKPAYYTKYALMFQLGDNLIVDMAINPVTGEPYLDYIYAVPDETKQIIKQAAFQSIVAGNAVQLFLKIATIDALSGDLIPLTSQQLAAFTNYMLNFEIPGLPLNIVNLPGNVLNFNATCTYIAAYDLPTLQINVANALTTFKDSFLFNGEFYSGDLQDYIKNNVPGVRDFYVYGTSLDGVPFSGSQALPSGYFNYQSGIDNNITYSSVQS